jgi:hypothetical protein
MTRSFHIAGLYAAAVLAGVTPSAAQAATFLFTGVRANVNLINPPGTGRCAPLNTVNIAPGALSSTGFSNFGAFASTQSHCIPGAPNAGNPVQPITDGQFSYDFGAGDLLTGTYSGQASFSNGVVTGTENLVVTGGTGRFAGATGFITSVGRLAFQPNPQGPGFVGVFNGTVNGRINVPGAVPEPATWAMMIAGFGLAGSAARRRRLQAAYA